MKRKDRADIGLLTWHYYKNVGSNLQAYAIHSVINHIGYSCAFINYRGEQRDCVVKNVIRSFCSVVGKYIPGLIPENLRAEAYRFQQDNFYMTKPIYRKKDLKKTRNKFKLFLCGSDQIWAPNVLNEVYLFSFLKDEQVRCSYAASIGLKEIPDELDKVYLKYLNKFSLITVREKQGCQLLKDKYNIDAQCVLDPTFLLPAEQWKRLAKSSGKNHKFLFCYFLGSNAKHRNWVSELQKATGFDVVCLSDNRNEHVSDWEFHYRIGPSHFLGFLLDCEFMVTDSFHGVALAINLQKPFYAVERFTEEDDKNQNSRVYHILTLLGLQKQLIRDCPHGVPTVDYALANHELEKERMRCLNLMREMFAEYCVD